MEWEGNMKKLIAEHQKKWAVCVAKAWADEDYKQRLLSDPTAVLKEEGVNVPETLDVRVVENTKNLVHMVLPLAPDSEAGAIEDVEERLAAMSCLCLCLLGQFQALGDALTSGLLGK
jgi:hypothetical protein